MLSADVTPEARRECLEAGADAFLSKPIEAAKLLEELQQMCGTSAQEAPRPVPAPAVRGSRPDQAEEVPTVNRATLADLEDLGSSSGFMEKLIGVFVADNVTLVAKMESTLAGRNIGEFRSHLHAMKGSAASMGAERLTVLCKDIGQLSDAEIRLQVLPLLKSLRDELAATREAFERYLQGRKKSAG
jgi:two-component system sensor histidine kinase RpfC